MDWGIESMKSINHWDQYCCESTITNNVTIITNFVTNITSFVIDKKKMAKQWLSSVFQAGALLQS